MKTAFACKHCSSTYQVIPKDGCYNCHSREFSEIELWLDEMPEYMNGYARRKS